MSNSGNILLVANWDSNVGYAWWLMENFWVTISDHFAKAGKLSYLIYPRITELPETIRASGIQVIQHDFKDRSVPNLLRLRRIIRQHQIRFLYLTDYPAYSPYYLLLKLLGVRKIAVHDHTPGDRSVPVPWRRLLKSTIQTLPLITADHFIAVSDFVYQRFIEVGCIPPAKCSCAPNGIVPIDTPLADPEYAHKAFNIPRDRIIVVTTGRATKYKGIEFVIQCANETVSNRRLSQLHFLFCGDGPDLQHFRELVRHYELDDHFSFAGKRTDIRQILPSCQIGFHASHGEVGYSLSILEYMSAGLATIVPDLPSTSEAIRDSENGLLYRHQDLASACDAIARCIPSTFRHRLSENAKSTVSEHYDIKTTNTALTSILENLFHSSPESHGHAW